MESEPFHILAVDGGGMRGLYAASVLRALAARFANGRNEEALDVGKGFDLVVGTSTGGILSAGVAAGVPLRRIQDLYRTEGPRVFTDPVPSNRLRFYCWLLRHLKSSGNSNVPLRKALLHTFGGETIGELYTRRRIALCLPATSLLSHAPRVFKTPHLESRNRDDNLSIVDLCLATSAAPIYLPLVSVTPDDPTSDSYVDGGLWANNPILVGLLEGLCASDPSQPITILSIGTCRPVAGSGPPAKLEVGVLDWLKRILLLNLVMNAQAAGSHNMSQLLAHQLGRLGKAVRIVRCHESSPSEDQSRLLQLDSATADAISLMQSMGENDGHQTYRRCQPPEAPDGVLLRSVFARMPAFENLAQGESNERLRQGH